MNLNLPLRNSESKVIREGKIKMKKCDNKSEG